MSRRPNPRSLTSSFLLPRSIAGGDDFDDIGSGSDGDEDLLVELFDETLTDAERTGDEKDGYRPFSRQIVRGGGSGQSGSPHMHSHTHPHIAKPFVLTPPQRKLLTSFIGRQRTTSGIPAFSTDTDPDPDADADSEFISMLESTPERTKSILLRAQRQEDLDMDQVLEFVDLEPECVRLRHISNLVRISAGRSRLLRVFAVEFGTGKSVIQQLEDCVRVWAGARGGPEAYLGELSALCDVLTEIMQLEGEKARPSVELIVCLIRIWCILEGKSSAGTVDREEQVVIRIIALLSLYVMILGSSYVVGAFRVHQKREVKAKPFSEIVHSLLRCSPLRESYHVSCFQFLNALVCQEALQKRDPRKGSELDERRMRRMRRKQRARQEEEERKRRSRSRRLVTADVVVEDDEWTVIDVDEDGEQEQEQSRVSSAPVQEKPKGRPRMRIPTVRVGENWIPLGKFIADSLYDSGWAQVYLRFCPKIRRESMMGKQFKQLQDRLYALRTAGDLPSDHFDVLKRLHDELLDFPDAVRHMNFVLRRMLEMTQKSKAIGARSGLVENWNSLQTLFHSAGVPTPEQPLLSFAPSGPVGSALRVLTDLLQTKSIEDVRVSDVVRDESFGSDLVKSFIRRLKSSVKTHSKAEKELITSLKKELTELRDGDGFGSIDDSDSALFPMTPGGGVGSSHSPVDVLNEIPDEALMAPPPAPDPDLIKFRGVRVRVYEDHALSDLFERFSAQPLKQLRMKPLTIVEYESSVFAQLESLDVQVASVAERLARMFPEKPPDPESGEEDSARRRPRPVVFESHLSDQVARRAMMTMRHLPSADTVIHGLQTFDEEVLETRQLETLADLLSFKDPSEKEELIVTLREARDSEFGLGLPPNEAFLARMLIDFNAFERAKCWLFMLEYDELFTRLKQNIESLCSSLKLLKSPHFFKFLQCVLVAGNVLTNRTCPLYSFTLEEASNMLQKMVSFDEEESVLESLLLVLRETEPDVLDFIPAFVELRVFDMNEVILVDAKSLRHGVSHCEDVADKSKKNELEEDVVWDVLHPKIIAWKYDQGKLDDSIKELDSLCLELACLFAVPVDEVKKGPFRKTARRLGKHCDRILKAIRKREMKTHERPKKRRQMHDCLYQQDDAPGCLDFAAESFSILAIQKQIAEQSLNLHHEEEQEEEGES